MNETPLQPVPDPVQDGGQRALPNARFCDELERRLMLELNQHRGRGQAIKLLALARATYITVREIQNLNNHLVRYHGIPIGSGATGVFLIETAEELEQTCITMKNRAIQTLVHLAALKKQHLAELLGQLRFELEK